MGIPGSTTIRQKVNALFEFTQNGLIGGDCDWNKRLKMLLLWRKGRDTFGLGRRASGRFFFIGFSICACGFALLFASCLCKWCIFPNGPLSLWSTTSDDTAAALISVVFRPGLALLAAFPFRIHVIHINLAKGQIGGFAFYGNIPLEWFHEVRVVHWEVMHETDKVTSILDYYEPAFVCIATRPGQTKLTYGRLNANTRSKSHAQQSAQWLADRFSKLLERPVSYNPSLLEHF